jgi:predicted TIM-barrel fold metal-dependent hydrolase
LHSLDEAGVDLAVLLAPFLDNPYTLRDATSLRAGNAHLARLVTGAEARLFGCAADDLEAAIADLGLRGLKMVPAGWYPYDDCAHRVYERAEQLGVPILFHSGIFIDGRSGRFCRPTFYESVRDYPRLRVALAHLGWPWTDEAVAVGLIDLIQGVPPAACQFRFDFSFGPPPVYREEVLRKALDVLGPELLQFGSDRFLPCSGAHIRQMIDEVETLFEHLALTPQARWQIMAGTAAAWLGLADKEGS